MNLRDFQSIRIYKPEHLPGWEMLDFDMVKKLDDWTLRMGLNVPATILSLFRTKEQNEAAGGAPFSMHLLGKAVDVAPQGDPLVAYSKAQEAGFTGIGLYVNPAGGFSMHMDNRPGAGARWGVLDGVMGGIDRVIDRLKSLAFIVVEKPAVSLGLLVLTAVALLYIFGRRENKK